MAKIKLLYYGDSPSVHTGFGVAARYILNHLYSSGNFDIQCVGINFYGDPHDQQHLNVYPVSTSNVYGTDKLAERLNNFKPDIFFVLNDYDFMYMIKDIIAQYRTQSQNRVKVVGYAPVDGEPFYPEYASFIKTLDHFTTISQYGKNTIKATDPTSNVDVVYHGVDHKVFYPESEIKRRELRDNFQGVDFIVGSVGTNQLRKQWAQMFEVFAEFAKDKPNVRFYAHTHPKFNVGWDLNKIAGNLNIDNKVFYPADLKGPVGVPFDGMHQIYNIMDVYMSLHCGEGFGIPVLEAMASGIPIIAHRATATEEIVDNAGILIDTESRYVFPMRDRSLNRFIANKKQAVDALNSLYSDVKLRRQLSESGYERSKKFPWSDSQKYFENVFYKLYEELNSKKSTIEEDFMQLL